MTEVRAQFIRGDYGVQRRNTLRRSRICLFEFDFISRSRFLGADNAQGMAAAVFEGFDGGGDFQDAIADGVESIGLVGFGEKFGFDDAGAVGDGDEFHGFAGGLVEKALFDDQAAGYDSFADVFAEAVDRAIGVPGDVGIEVERVAAHGIAEEFLFGAETFERGGFGEGDGGETVGIG